jgi:general secretion pathway protein C
VAVGEASVTRGDLSRLLGAGPAAAPAAADVPAADADAASRFKLVGVMAPRKGSRAGNQAGLALIAIDGKPAKAYAVGATVDGDMLLQRVSLRSAAIGPADGAAMILEVPPLTAAATGTLAPAGSFGAAAPMPAAPPPPPIVRPSVRPGQVMPAPQPVPGLSMPGTPPVQMQRETGAPSQ